MRTFAFTIISLSIALITACSENHQKDSETTSWSTYKVEDASIVLNVPGAVKEQNGFFKINNQSILQKAYIVDIDNELYHYAFANLKNNAPQTLEDQKSLVRLKASERMKALSAVITDSTWNIKGDSITYHIKGKSTDGSNVFSETRIILCKGLFHQFFIGKENKSPDASAVQKFAIDFQLAKQSKPKTTAIVGFYSNDTLSFKTKSNTEPKIVSTEGDGEYGPMVMSFCTWFSEDSITRMCTVVRYKNGTPLAEIKNLDKNTAISFFKNLNLDISDKDMIIGDNEVKVEKNTKTGFTIYKTTHTGNTIFQVVAESKDASLIEKGKDFVDSFEVLK